MAIISIRDLVKSYGEGDQKRVILDHFHLEIEEHTFNSILGRSGSGKTTLLNIMSTLDEYDSGEVRIDGFNTKELETNALNQLRNQFIGFVFQDFNLISSLNILDNVALPLLVNHYTILEARKQAANALAKVGLNQFIHMKPDELSGGQKQRVAIARAIVNGQKIILCDEPTGSLDEIISLEILGVLKELSKEKTIIMVTHDEAYAKRFSDRIIILSDGEIIKDSQPVKQNIKSLSSFEPTKNSMRLQGLFYLSRNSFQMSDKHLSKALRLIVYSTIIFLLATYVSSHFVSIFNSIFSGQPFSAPIFKIISQMVIVGIIYLMFGLSFLSFMFIFTAVIKQKKKEIAVMKAFGMNKTIINGLIMVKTFKFAFSILIYLIIYLFIVLVCLNSLNYLPHLMNAEFDVFVTKSINISLDVLKAFFNKNYKGVISVYYLKFILTYLFVILVTTLVVILSTFLINKDDTIRVLARE